MTDNQDILNEAEVDFLLASGGEHDDGAETPLLEDGNQTVTMHGDLDQISLADIFQTLAMSQMEGVLRVRTPLEERQIYCHDGHARILVPPRLTLRRLGQRLIQAGMLLPEQLRSALIEQRKEKVPLGELLVRDGLVTQENLDDIVGMQIAEDLFSLFTWKHGTFEFFKGTPSSDVLRSQFEQCPEYEVNSLLLEVARRSDEWQSILAAVASLDEIPRQIAQPAKPDELEASHQAVLSGIDGRLTYRQLSEHTTIGLFEYARAARDLVTGGILKNIDDPALIEVAANLASEGDNKRAIVLLQTLRDRDGDRSMGVMQSMADILEQAGERRFASSLLLEAAQRSPDAESALELARTARALVPYDPGTLSFLRTVLVAHSKPDSAELEKCTIDLLDALIDSDLIPTALEIIEDARRTHTMRPPILIREARARQKAKDFEGAIEALSQLVTHYQSENNRTKAIEALEAILRLDRSRKDVARTLAQLRRTKASNMIRLAAAILVLALLGGMGLVWWQQNAFDESVRQATSEVQVLLDQGDRVGARATLEQWRASLGDCEPMQDLASRVTFAESAESNRLAKLQRARINEQLTKAATALGRGELANALTIYGLVHQERGMQSEVREVVTTRMAALIEQLVRASEQLRNRLPPSPNKIFDRAQVTANLARLQASCPPALVRSFDELDHLVRQDSLPSFIDEATRQRIQSALADAKPDIARYRQLSDAYAKALERNDTQRRLDPMFKAAVEKESEHDFAGALQLYRQLESQPTGDNELRTHFRDRVTRNATITRLLSALATATKAGDFGTAQQHLRALRLSFPDVPFDDLVRLPLMLRSEPSNAGVLVNGQDLGRTPILLSRMPADETNVVVTSDGFASTHHQFVGDAVPEWTAHLTLQPSSTWPHTSAIESPPAATPDEHLIFVDRGGKVSKLSATLQETQWSFASGDLSGWLTDPLIDNEQVVLASLDGTLRALNLANGELAWSLDELPCEVQPVLIDHTLALATTDGRLHAIDLAARRRQSQDLPQRAFGELIRHGQNVIAVGQDGSVSSWSMPSLEPVWQRELAHLRSPRAVRQGDLLVVGDDQGRLFALDASTGEVRWQRKLDIALLGGFATGNGKIILVAPERMQLLDTATGRDLDVWTNQRGDWTGEAVVAGNRLIAPRRDGGLQVMHSTTGQMLYLLNGDAKSRVLLAGTSVFVCATDHTVHSYGRLR